jgi:hypothetical protein
MTASMTELALFSLAVLGLAGLRLVVLIEIASLRLAIFP